MYERGFQGSEHFLIFDVCCICIIMCFVIVLCKCALCTYVWGTGCTLWFIFKKRLKIGNVNFTKKIWQLSRKEKAFLMHEDFKGVSMKQDTKKNKKTMHSENYYINLQCYYLWCCCRTVSFPIEFFQLHVKKWDSNLTEQQRNVLSYKRSPG